MRIEPPADFADELAVYDDVEERFAGTADPDERVHVARALVRKGLRLSEVGKRDEAIELFDRVSSRFQDDPEPRAREMAAFSLCLTAGEIGELGRFDEAIAV
jgi:hypothetical protein